MHSKSNCTWRHFRRPSQATNSLLKYANQWQGYSFLNLAHFSRLPCHDKLGSYPGTMGECWERSALYPWCPERHLCCTVVCGNARVGHHSYLSHFPSNHEKHALWLKVFQLTEEQFKPHHRVCSRHFRDGNPQKGADVGLGKCYASPVKKGAPMINVRLGELNSSLVTASCHSIEIRHLSAQQSFSVLTQAIALVHTSHNVARILAST